MPLQNTIKLVFPPDFNDKYGYPYILRTQSCPCAEVNLRATEEKLNLVMKREEKSLLSSPVGGGGMRL
jgi:hypothetical protein